MATGDPRDCDFTGLSFGGSVYQYAVVSNGVVQWGIKDDGEFIGFHASGRALYMSKPQTYLPRCDSYGDNQTGPRVCPYCNTIGGESTYHHGTCANCGGIL
jgi:hypothetical protein